jgi:hypothetical protein
MHLFELVDVNREILQWLKKIWTIHLNKSNCIKIAGTNVKILIDTKLMGSTKISGTNTKIGGIISVFLLFYYI